MKYTNFNGTGNENCSVNIHLQVELNNIPITPKLIRDFFRFIGTDGVKVKFYNPTKRRWGTARMRNGEYSIILRRHSCWIFLHEFAHILAGIHNGHNKKFGKVLDELFHQFINFYTER